MNKLLEARNVSRFFDDGNSEVKAVNNVSLSIDKNEKIVIYGKSGSGKSTLLNLLCGLEKFTKGDISFKNISYENNHKKLTLIRRDFMGFVYQFHYLLNEFTALENTAISAMILGENKKNAMIKAQEILEKFGLVSRLHHFPSQLSGGEKQRVAMARSLINNPDIIFLDEPTGNLDNETSKMLIDFLKNTSDEFNSAVVVATHDSEFRNFGDKILTMDSGVFV